MSATIPTSRRRPWAGRIRTWAGFVLVAWMLACSPDPTPGADPHAVADAATQRLGRITESPPFPLSDTATESLLLDVRPEPGPGLAETSSGFAIEFGRRFVLEVRTATRAGFQVESIPQDAFGPQTPERRAPATRSTVGTWNRASHRFVFVADQLEAIEIPSLVLRASRDTTDGQPSESVVAISDAFEIEVLSGLPPEDSGTAEFPGGWLPAPRRIPVGWILAGGLAVVGVLWVTLGYRRSRRDPAPARNSVQTELDAIRLQQDQVPTEILADALANWTRTTLGREGLNSAAATEAELVTQRDSDANEAHPNAALLGAGALLLRWCDNARYRAPTPRPEQDPGLQSSPPWEVAETLARAAERPRHQEAGIGFADPNP